MLTTVQFDYRNWKDISRRRRVKPIAIWFGCTDWHPEKQWLLTAFDLDKCEERDFAMSNIRNWKQDEYIRND